MHNAYNKKHMVREFSKNRRRLLRLFYANPDQAYYIQQIGRILHKKPGVFQRTLNNLEKQGVLTSEFKANARYFRVNKGYAIYSELKSIVSKTLIIFFLIFYFAAIAFCGEAKTQNFVSLSMEDAISLAFGNNKDIQIQEQEIAVATADITSVRSAMLPKINLDSGYTYNGAVTPIIVPPGKKDIGVFTGYKNDNLLGISLGDSIYNGGADFAHLKQAKFGLLVEKETLRAKKLDVEFEAKRLYYGLLLAFETERITQELVDNAGLHYQDVKNKFTQGTSSRFDLLQSKVQLSLLMPEMVKAKNAVDLIMADLKKLLGLKMQNEITLKDTQLDFSKIEIKEGEFLKQAYLNKPEMGLRSLGIDINKWSIEMAKAGWRPQINADLGYTYRSNSVTNMFNSRHNNWHTGVSVTLPLFDGFSTKAKVEAAKARYAQASLLKEDLVEQIAVDIRRACLDLKQAEQIIESQRDNLQEAKEALNIANVSYDNGAGTNLDVLDAQVSLSQVKKNISEGIYDYLIAKASLDRTRGESLIKERTK